MCVSDMRPYLPSSWIVHAMRYELQIRNQMRGGEQSETDIYQLSPGEIKQLLLCILKPQQSGR